MILFKTENEKQEWNDSKLDNRLKFIVYSISGYVKEKWNVDLTITEVFRIQQEQDRVYKDNPEYKISPWLSVHQEWRGIDFRSTDFTNEQINELLKYINDIVDYGRIGKNTMICHDVGSGLHLHLQVSYLEQTMLKK